MTPCNECNERADHLLLPQKLDLCTEHYRERRPYRIDVAAFATFADLLTPGEREAWLMIVDENEEAEADSELAHRVVQLLKDNDEQKVGGQLISFDEWLAKRRQYRLAVAADQVAGLDPAEVRVGRASWPLLIEQR